MTTLIGTGNDPRFPVGQPFDVSDAEAKLLTTEGLAVEPTPEDDPRFVEHVAQAMVRGDHLVLPAERAVAERLDPTRRADTASNDPEVAAAVRSGQPTEHDVVHGGQGAAPGASEVSAEEAFNRKHKVDPLEVALPGDATDPDTVKQGQPQKPAEAPRPADAEKVTVEAGGKPKAAAPPAAKDEGKGE